MKRLALCLAAFAGIVQAQGDGAACSLSHKLAAPGQTVTLTCREQGNSIKTYQVSWVLEPTPISSKRTFIVKLKATANPVGLPMVGVNELKAEFKDLQTGVYRIQFDSAGDFRADLGDAAVFEVAASLRVRDAGPTGALKPPAPAAMSLARWRIDGRKAWKERP